MIEQTKKEIDSHELAVELYDTWVRERQSRPDVECSDEPKDLNKFRKKNFENQVVNPRRNHLKELKSVAKAMTTADKVAILVMMELPVLETTTLLHRLSRQLAENPKASFFSKENLVAACGCGCG